MLFITLLTTITSCFGEIHFEAEKIEVNPVANCLYEVCKLYSNANKLTVGIYENDYLETEHNAFIDALLTKLVSTKIPYTKTNDIDRLINTTELYESTMIITAYIKSCDELIDIDLIKFDIKFKYMLIVDKVLSKECVRNVETKLSELKNYDATIIALSENGYYHFLAMIPEIDADTCQIGEIVEIKIINACIKGDIERKNINYIFPDKIPTDFKKCDFKVGMATLYPYSMLKSNDTLEDLDYTESFYGADVEVVKIMANKFNGNLKIFYVYRHEGYPFLHLNLRHYVMNGSLDVCAGGLYRIYGDEVAYSGIYSRQSVIWVYAAEREIRSWQSLASKITGLYVFIIFYIIYAALWIIISKLNNQAVSIGNTFFYSWGALIGTSDLPYAETIKQKFLNILYLILCLHFSAYVSTQIYYYLTIVKPPEHFKTLAELKTSDKTPYLMEVAKYFIDDKKHNAFVNTSYDCDTFPDCEEKLLKNKGSTIIIDGQLPPWQSSTAVNDEARVLRVVEDVLVVYHEMVLRKNSTIVLAFQKTTLRLFETGICQKLFIDSIGLIVVDKAKIANENLLANSYRCTVGCEITMSELAGAFYIWIIGCVLSSCTFAYEYLSNSRLKNN